MKTWIKVVLGPLNIHFFVTACLVRHGSPLRNIHVSDHLLSRMIVSMFHALHPTRIMRMTGFSCIKGNRNWPNIKQWLTLYITTIGMQRSWNPCHTTGGKVFVDGDFLWYRDVFCDVEFPVTSWEKEESKWPFPCHEDPDGRQVIPMVSSSHRHESCRNTNCK